MVIVNSYVSFPEGNLAHSLSEAKDTEEILAEPYIDITNAV